MNIISKKKQETFILTFIDQQTNEQINKNRQIFVPQTVKDDVSIDFTQMLQRQWRVQQDDNILNSKPRIQNENAKKIQKTIKNFNLHAENGGLVTCRFKKNNHLIKLLDVQTIFDSPIQQEDIDEFLQSSCFKMSIRVFILIFIVGIAITDYSFRLSSHPHFPQPSTLNTLSLHFQLFANCAFSLQILLKMFSKHKFFQNPWNILNLVGCISCWSIIFLDMMYFDDEPVYHAVCILKILLGIRIVEMFQFIKGPFESFITTIPELGKIFFPYLIFVSMYSVLGLILFMGANEQRCRQTASPINGAWPQVAPNLCGSGEYTCPIGTCGNPYSYGLPMNDTEKYQYPNQFGLVSYDNVAYAALTTYHYMFLASWTAIMFKYSKYMNPYLTIIYFFTSAIFLFFIMANLNMITLCKAFIEKQKSKEKYNQGKESEVQPDEQEDLLSKLTHLQLTLFEILRYGEIFLIIINSIVILIEYENMEREVKTIVNKADFFLTLFCILGLSFRVMLFKGDIVREKFALLDSLCLIISVGDFIYCGAFGTSVMDPSQNAHRLLRGIKIARIIRILYFFKTWCTFQKTILKIFLQTLNSVKSFFFLLFSVILIFAFIGQSLFANRVKFLPGTNIFNLTSGFSYVANFDNIYKALICVTYLLENEHWGDIMYMHYIATGWPAVLYFTVAVLLLHLLLARLFIAIFLCYFRRNLQKKHESEQEQLEGNSKLEICRHTPKSKQEVQMPQMLQNQSNNNTTDDDDKEDKNEEERIFWIFKNNHCFFQFLRACYNSLLFHRVMIGMIGLHCLTIVARTDLDCDKKTLALDIVEYIPLSFYIFELLIGVLGFGLFFGPKTYLKQSKMNYINILVFILVILSELDWIGEMEARILRRCAIVKILTLFTRTNKETSIMLDSISAIAESYVRMIGIYIFLLILSCLVPLKLNNDELYYCYNYPMAFNSLPPQNYRDCMLGGGDWIGDTQKFSNIFESVVLMYQIVTSQSWIYFIERFKRDQPWDVFFVLNFFIYNICLLNIFVGLTVETFLSLKDKAYKLNLLRPNQRMWLLIRNCINQLVPVPIMKQPEEKSKFRKRAYKIISQPIYQNFIDVLPYINVFIYVLKYYRANPNYINNLDIVNIAIIVIFMVDTLLKLQLHWNFFYLSNSRIQFCGFVYFIIYGLFSFTIDFSHQAKLALEFIGAFFLILRCKKLIFRFTWCKTLLNSVIEVLPKCVIIGTLLAVVLFFYISIGMQIFKHTKPTKQSDGYTTGFNNAFTSLVTLLKIVSNQTWFFQVSAFARNSTPADVCFTAEMIIAEPRLTEMECGTPFAYVYFISFHMIISLLVLNLFIATMTAAYDQNYEKQYKSVNIFQLQDCLKLWQKYDPNGTGLIAYKKFWRLSSEIAILFGISKKKLIKSKQKFLEELDIEICQSTDPKHTSVLCYKFHDVLIKFSKIKLTVSKNDGNQQCNETLDFEIHPMIEREIKDYITKAPQLYDNIKTYKNLKSGEMKYFFGLLRKMRAWKIVAKKKDSSAISKLSHIIKIALEKKQRQEVEITRIRNSMSNFLAPIIS